MLYLLHTRVPDLDVYAALYVGTDYHSYIGIGVANGEIVLIAGETGLIVLIGVDAEKGEVLLEVLQEEATGEVFQATLFALYINSYARAFCEEALRF